MRSFPFEETRGGEITRSVVRNVEDWNEEKKISLRKKDEELEEKEEEEEEEMEEDKIKKARTH